MFGGCHIATVDGEYAPKDADGNYVRLPLPLRLLLPAHCRQAYAFPTSSTRRQNAGTPLHCLRTRLEHHRTDPPSFHALLGG